MSSLVTPCPICGGVLDPASSHECLSPSPEVSVPVEKKPPWGMVAAILIWVASVGLTLIVPLIAIGIYILGFDRNALEVLGNKQFTLGTGLTFIAGTLIAHLLILALCWAVVTSMGRREFLPTLGWGWHPRFKWPQTIGLSIGMLGIGILLEQVLPHGETDMDQLLRLGLPMRIGIAALAVVTAPLVEEVIYRGVLFSALERAAGRGVSVIIVALLFGAVHVPQYWNSLAAITAVMLLSLVLTLLRATTGKLLPCVATHLIFNGIQAVAIIYQAPRPPLAEPVKVTARAAWHLLGCG